MRQKKFAQHWHAARILDDLNAVNPNFYPVPGLQIKDETTGKVKAVDTPKKPFLTKSDFVTLYEMCGGILHAENPYGQPRDIATSGREDGRMARQEGHAVKPSSDSASRLRLDAVGYYARGK